MSEARIPPQDHRRAALPPTVRHASRRRTRWLKIAAVGLIAGALGVSLLVACWPRHDDVAEDPRVTYATPFRNVRPDVQYLGDETCAGCHRDVSRTYHQHPMGRSVTPIAEAAPAERYDAAAFNPFDALGAQFRIVREDGRVRHQEVRRDAQGAILAETQAEIQFAIGAGAQATSYLFSRDDYLFQSPISWFRDKERWNLSPGFDRLNDRFERPVRTECLFCHVNYAEPIKDTLNRFALPFFPRGMAIGCERCHGPGELHVRERKQRLSIANGMDHSIVNPRHLAPELREAVCQQCHLEGEPRILRRGRQPFDYRPGLPLQLFWTIFVRLAGVTEPGHFVGQVEQMHASRCFTQSMGKLDCTTCHDAHEQPAAGKKTVIYREHCVECHQEKHCTETLARRRAHNDDDCVSCHMARLPSANISHTSITDHRIVRRAETAAALPTPRKLLTGELPCVDFYKNLTEPGDPEVGRGTGLALVELAERNKPLAVQLGETAMPYLEAALRRWPQDAAVNEAHAFVLAQQGKHTAALAVMEKVLARAPQREPALAAAANHAEKSGEFARAAELWRRAIAVSPWRSEYRMGEARALNLLGKHDAAIAACQEVLKFNPGSVRARALLVSSYLETRRKERAEAEFEIIMKLNPPNKEDLRKWFETQTR